MFRPCTFCSARACNPAHPASPRSVVASFRENQIQILAPAGRPPPNEKKVTEPLKADCYPVTVSAGGGIFSKTGALRGVCLWTKSRRHRRHALHTGLNSFNFSPRKTPSPAAETCTGSSSRWRRSHSHRPAGRPFRRSAHTPFKTCSPPSPSCPNPPPSHPHVAIFWLASEDHDFAEIDHVTFPAGRELAGSCTKKSRVRIARRGRSSFRRTINHAARRARHRASRPVRTDALSLPTSPAAPSRRPSPISTRLSSRRNASSSLMPQAVTFHLRLLCPRLLSRSHRARARVPRYARRTQRLLKPPAITRRSPSHRSRACSVPWIRRKNRRSHRASPHRAQCSRA